MTAILALVFISVSSFHFATPAVAQTATCSRLQSQLAALDRRGSPRGVSRSFQRSINAQKEQISQVTGRMSALGCAAKRGFFTREAHPSCGGLRNSLKRMQRNLRVLEAGGSPATSGSENERRRIVRAMHRNACGERGPNDGIRRTSIIQQIFGGEAARQRREQAARDRQALEDARAAQRQAAETSEPRIGLSGTGTTICVRTCDGYYFPVSFSTENNSIEEYAQACNNLCPGPPMQLYTNRNSEDGPESMISTFDGSSYAELPKAFSFRDKYDPNCSCNYRLLKRQKETPWTEPQPQEAQDAQAVDAGAIDTLAISVPGRIAIPTWRVGDAQGESDAAVNASIAITGANPDKTENEAARPQPNYKPVVVETTRNRRVRIIGESFFPSQ